MTCSRRAAEISLDPCTGGTAQYAASQREVSAFHVSFFFFFFVFFVEVCRVREAAVDGM